MVKLFFGFLSFVLAAGFCDAQKITAASFDRVNSAYDETDPVISPDGKTLFFTRSNDAQNTGGIRDPGDIWFSILMDDNTWSAPVNAGDVLNDRTYNAVAGFSADGSDMFLMNHFDPSGDAARTQGLSVSHKSGEGWSRPRNISIPFFRNESPFISGYITPDESVFVYSAENYGTVGVEDIYVTLKDASGNWTEPKDLGTTINTQFQELSPFLSADKKTLYFSSNGRRGLGSFDVYRSTRLDDTWENWTTPVNIGEPFNSVGRDLYFSQYPDLGLTLYTATVNSDGYGDIRCYRPDSLQNQIPIQHPIISATSDTVNIRPNVYDSSRSNAIEVLGTVIDAVSGRTIPAHLLFTSGTDQHPVDAKPDEGFHLQLSSIGSYDVKIESAGYISTLETLDLNTVQMNKVDVSFKLQPVKKGATVTLKNVLFAQGTTDLLPSSYPELDVVVNFMQENPRVEIGLAGYTDNRGSAVLNLQLSQDRVDKVKDYLVSKGISKKRISGKGYGSAHPIASNDTEESRRLNRRVEFTIVKE